MGFATPLEGVNTVYASGFRLLPLVSMGPFDAYGSSCEVQSVFQEATSVLDICRCLTVVYVMGCCWATMVLHVLPSGAVTASLLCISMVVCACAPATLRYLPQGAVLARRCPCLMVFHA